MTNSNGNHEPDLPNDPNDDQGGANHVTMTSGFARLDQRLDTMTQRLDQMFRALAFGGASLALSLALFMGLVVWAVAVTGSG